MKSIIRTINDHGIQYDALMFVCPGCESMKGSGSGLHMLPVNSKVKNPQWTWDGNLIKPTLSPSILTRYPMVDHEEICHSFLRGGIFQFLSDCTHKFAGKEVPMPDLYDWAVKQ